MAKGKVMSNAEYRKTEGISSTEPAEEWRDVKGFEGWYQVSNLGRVKRVKRISGCGTKKNAKMIVFKEYILKPHYSDGYRKVTIKCNGKHKHVGIYKLMAEAFIPNPENKPQVDHINRIRDDDRLENLRWVTNQENQFNSRRNIIIEHNGLKAPLTIHCRLNNIKISTVKYRLNAGWSVHDALTKERGCVSNGK